MPSYAIEASHLSKQYRIGAHKPYRMFREALMDTATMPLRAIKRRLSSTPAPPATNSFWALDDISFGIQPGEIVGVIGRNGAGKSTLLKVLSRITEPTKGYADIEGRIGSLLEVGTGFHGELTGRENIYLNGAILGMKRARIDSQFHAIVAFAGVEKFIDTPVKHYSSGMYLRLAFAVAAHLDPEIMLIDEVLAVGDAAFQRKCLGRMSEVAQEGRTVLFVSHNMGAIRSLCKRGLVLHQGRVVEFGPIGQAIETYYKLSEEEDRNAADKTFTRSGFGRMKLTSHESTTIEQSDAFEVSTTFHIASEAAGFTLLCLLEDMNQRPVAHLRQDSSAFASRRDWQGTHDVSVRFPALWLEPGMFTLYFKLLLWGEGASARHVSDVLHLDVGGDSGGWGAVLNPKVEWTVGAAVPEEVLL